MTTSAPSTPQTKPSGGARAAPPATPLRELEHRLIAPVLGKTEVVRLPGLPIVIDRALKASRESADAGVLAEWVALDPTLTARVLEATSAAGQVREEVQFLPLEQRLATLGPELAKAMLVHAARCALGAERQTLTPRELSGYWMHALRCAYLSRGLAESSGYPRPEEAYLVGLLHDFGSFALLIAVPNTFRSLVADQVSADHEAIPEHAGRLGTIHAQIGAALLGRLGLPFYASDAVLLHHAPMAELEGTHALVRILRCAEALAHPRVRLEQLKAVGELLGIGAAEISGVDKAALEAAHGVLRKLGLARPEAGTAVPPDTVQPASVVDMQRLSDTLVMRFVKETHEPPPGEGARTAGPEPEAGARLGGEPVGSASGWMEALPSPRGIVSSLFGQIATEAARLEVQAALGSANDAQSALSAILPLVGIVTGLKRAVLFVAAEGAGDWPGWIVDADGAAPFDLSLATGVSRSMVARAAREAQTVASYAQGGTRGLAGVDLQIARILGADDIAALPLLGDGPGCRGLVVFGSIAPRAHHFAESLPFLGELARLIGRAIAPSARAPSATVSGEPIERMRAATKRLVHEARNPLSVLKTYLEIARARAGQDLASELEIAGREIERVARLLDSISQAGERKPEGAVPTDVNRMIKELLSVYGEALFASKAIGQSTMLDANLPLLACDEEALKQVLLNLLKNASEAMQGGGQVLVGTCDRVNYEGQMMAELWVADSGPGISSETMAELFAARPGGVRSGERGLGLTTSLALVKSMNGHLLCRSQPEGGTTFSILLPRGDPASVSSLKSDVPRPTELDPPSLNFTD